VDGSESEGLRWRISSGAARLEHVSCTGHETVVRPAEKNVLVTPSHSDAVGARLRGLQRKDETG